MAKTKMHYRLKQGNDECNGASLTPTPAPLRAPGRALGQRLPVGVADDEAGAPLSSTDQGGGKRREAAEALDSLGDTLLVA